MDPALAKEVAMLARTFNINEAIDKGDSKIQEFYKDTTILITGGSGFMGKQLLEKIFRSCDIKKVFLLMRPKKKKDFHERLNTILEDPVFDTVKRMHPGFEKKICVVQGDVAEPSLGITMEEREAIIAETDIIIHAAATINFEEPLKVAINTNVRGTVEMLKIGKQCKKLKSYVHVSTAYAHATYSRINKAVDEQFYETALTPELAIKLVEIMDEKCLKDITPKLIQNWPNTYTFTKAIAEEAVREVGFELPISIVRPAVVISSYLEPSPGWLDTSCAFGPTGILLGTGLGVIHTLLCYSKSQMDIVPVDRVNNAIILAGWAAAGRNRENENYEPRIYTVTSRRNQISYQYMIDTLFDLGNRYMTPKLLYYPFMQTTVYPTMYIMLNWLLHYIPGYLVDLVLLIMRKKPIAVKLYTKFEKRAQVYSFFSTHEWIFGDKNLQKLFMDQNETDRQIYNCDLACLNWKDMMTTWILGTRRYILKDGLQGTEYGLKKHFWLKLLHFSVVIPLYFYLLYKVAMSAFTIVYFVSNVIFGLC